MIHHATRAVQIAGITTNPDGRFMAQVARNLTADDDGFYRLHVTEELWEAAFFDYVRLRVVDHPSAVQDKAACWRDTPCAGSWTVQSAAAPTVTRGG